jgi:Holliday junction resolvasome RuvABC endonuclease subunit
MNILALDLGTTTGWALTPSTGAIVSGTWQNKSRNARYEGGGMRYLRFRQQLDEMHAAMPIGAVYFEEVRRHRGTDAAHVYGGMLAMLTAWCEDQHPKVPYQGTPVGDIKRYITGKGNADKDAVIAAVTALGYQPADDNEADAIALALLVRSGGAA